MAVAKLPVYLRVGTAPEREVATIELTPDGAGRVEMGSQQVVSSLVDTLREVADELEAQASRCDHPGT